MFTFQTTLKPEWIDYSDLKQDKTPIGTRKDGQLGSISECQAGK